MESVNLRNDVDGPRAAHDFDAFLSYSRKDTAFAVRLESALESYRFPKGLQSVKRSLNVFRDESDITASDDYHRTIEQHLKGSAKLVVICSPDARKSQYVEDEIRRFIQTRGEQDIYSSPASSPMSKYGHAALSLDGKTIAVTAKASDYKILTNDSGCNMVRTLVYSEGWSSELR